MMKPKTKKILSQFKDFTDGIRMIMLTLRNKDGGKSNKPDRSAIRRISTNQNEFEKILEEFLERQSEHPEYRIYSCVNRRNFNKAIREFKRQQLEADYYDIESRNRFYLDIKNRFLGSLMKPSSRAETKFLIDLDGGEVERYKSLVEDKLKDLKVKVLLNYPTKNGEHLITSPFNPNDLAIPDYDKLFVPEIKKDALLLLSW